jgi:hypothetical protein
MEPWVGNGVAAPGTAQVQRHTRVQNGGSARFWAFAGVRLRLLNKRGLLMRNKNLGVPEAISEAFRQGFDSGYGGGGGLNDCLVRSIVSELVASENNEPGSELTRGGLGSNYAGLLTQELTNDFIRGRYTEEK